MALGVYGPHDFGFRPVRVVLTDGAGKQVPTRNASGAEAPATVDAQGHVSFYATAGSYTLSAYQAGNAVPSTSSITVTALPAPPTPLTPDQVQAAVTTETARAQAAEALAARLTDLSSETGRAEAAEALLATVTSLATETARAEAAEALGQITVYTLAAQPAATGSGKVVFISNDGPGALYKDTAAGVWTPLNPGEIAYAANVTGTVTGVTTVEADVPGLSITVPKSSRPVWINAYAWVQQTALAGGLAVLSLYETTSGAVFVTNFGGALPNSTGAGSAYFTIKGTYRLGATTGVRTFKLRTSITRDAGSLATANLLNNSVAGFFSWVNAEAR